MIEKRPIANFIGHLVLIIGVIIVAFPIYYTFVASTRTSVEIIRPPMSLTIGDQLTENYTEAMSEGVERVVGVSLERLLFNSTVVAIAIAVGKIVISFLSAFAIVFFRFPLKMAFFWMIFITLMLPVEVRILPTHKVIVDLGLIDTYAGLTLPLMASATATFLFRQFFLTIRANWWKRHASTMPGPFASCATFCFLFQKLTLQRCSSSCSSMAGRSISGPCW